MDNTEAIDIHLDIFEGPMDLLMHLIKKHNLDIYDIPISQITKEYLEYIEIMKELNLDVAGEFLVMASTLMQVKAKMLLPSTEDAAGEDGPDPRRELVEKLEEYQKFKKVSSDLEEKFLTYRDVFYRGSPVFSNEEKFLDVEFFSLMDALKRALNKNKDVRAVEGETFPIEPRIKRILSSLKDKKGVSVDEIFSAETKRMGIITCFMAVLELVKQRKIAVRQDEELSEIRLYLLEEPGEEKINSEDAEYGRA